jgi:hypothetical protein
MTSFLSSDKTIWNRRSIVPNLTNIKYNIVDVACLRANVRRSALLFRDVEYLL